MVQSRPNRPGAGCRHPRLHPAVKEEPLSRRKRTAAWKLPLGLCLPAGRCQWSPSSWQSGGRVATTPALPGARITAMSAAHVTLYLVSGFSARTVHNGCQTLNFLSCCLYLISDSPCFFKSQLLKILCLNICQGLGIS